MYIRNSIKKEENFWIFLFQTLNDIYLTVPMQIVIILMFQGNIEMYFKLLYILASTITVHHIIKCLRLIIWRIKVIDFTQDFLIKSQLSNFNKRFLSKMICSLHFPSVWHREITGSRKHYLPVNKNIHLDGMGQ